MLHLLHGLLRKKGPHELPSLFAAVFLLCLASSVGGAEELKKLSAENRCVSGRLDGIQLGQGGAGGTQDVTVDRGETMIKHRGTKPTDSFRAMVRTGHPTGYKLVVDYERKREKECAATITGLVKETKGCELAEGWHVGSCVGGTCFGGGLRVGCALSEKQTVQNGSVPTGYFVADVAVWSPEACLSVSAKFTDTDKNFCYLVPRLLVPDDHLKETKTVEEFMGMTTTASATEATTTTAVKTTTEKTNETTEGRSSTMTATGNTTAAETTTQEPTTKDPGVSTDQSYWSSSYCVDTTWIAMGLCLSFCRTAVAVALVIAVFLRRACNPDAKPADGKSTAAAKTTTEGSKKLKKAGKTTTL